MSLRRMSSTRGAILRRCALRISTLVWLGVFLWGLALPVHGQEQKKNAGPGILGYLDPQTGFFHPAASGATVDSSQLLPSVVPTTGKLVFNFTISVQSAIPTTDTIVCEASAEVLEVTTQHAVEEAASVAATRSGTTAKCTVTIPYSWVLTTPKTDTVTLTYTLFAPTAAPLLPSRTSTQTVAVIPVPLTGATTTEAVSAVF